MSARSIVAPVPGCPYGLAIWAQVRRGFDPVHFVVTLSTCCPAVGPLYFTRKPFQYAAFRAPSLAAARTLAAELAQRLA